MGNNTISTVFLGIDVHKRAIPAVREFYQLKS